MAIYLLNISVDTVDLIPEHVPQDVSYNAQESVVEIVVEKILGFDDAIEEIDENDNEVPKKKPNLKIDLVFYSEINTEPFGYPFLPEEGWTSELNSLLISGFCNLDTPPPKI